MKKTLIAVAALASTAAFAQNVTLSGTVDAGLEKTSSANPWTMASSRLGTTNFTLSGSEDLGGGLKAIFKVSSSFDASFSNAGATTDQVIGNNDMFVGVEGGFGSLKLGRTFDPVFWYTQTANSTKGVTGYTARAGAVDMGTVGVYVANQVLYTTPNMGGLQAQLSYAPSEVVGTDAHTAGAIGYAAGPIWAALSYSKTGAGAAQTAVSANYDLKVAKIFATFTDRDVAGDSSSYNLGVSVPMGAVTLWGDYTNNDRTNREVVQLGAKYALSKRSTAYFNYGNNKVTGAASTTGYGFGLAHNF